MLHRGTERDATTHVHRMRNDTLKKLNWEREGALGGSDMIHVAIWLSEQMRSKNLMFICTFPEFQRVLFSLYILNVHII